MIYLLEGGWLKTILTGLEDRKIVLLLPVANHKWHIRMYKLMNVICHLQLGTDSESSLILSSRPIRP